MLLYENHSPGKTTSSKTTSSRAPAKASGKKRPASAADQKPPSKATKKSAIVESDSEDDDVPIGTMMKRKGSA